MASALIFELRLENWITKGPLWGQGPWGLIQSTKSDNFPPNFPKVMPCRYISQKISKIFSVSVSVSVSRLLPISGMSWYGDFGLWKKVSFSVSENLVSENKSRFQSKFWSRHSVTSAHIGFMILLSLLLGNAETDGEYWRSQKEEIKNLLLCRLEEEGRNIDGGLGIWRVGAILIKQSKDKYFYPVLDQGQHRWWHFERSTVWVTQQQARPHGAGLSLPPAPPPNRPEV